MSLAFLASCSNDDGATTPGEDPIIGSWVLVDASAPLDSQFCFDEDSVISFNEDNTGEATFYLTADECSATESEGIWSNDGNSNYTITVPVLGELEGKANFTSDNRFTFTTAVAGFPAVLTFERR